MMPLSRVHQPELLDTDVATAPRRVLEQNLRDIRLANRYFGGTRAVLRAVMPVIRACASSDQMVSLLDVATGSADIPLAIAQRARRQGCALHITATDVQPEVLAVARGRTVAAGIKVEVADALALHYPDASFDIVTLSLALHHLDARDAVRALDEMRRVGRRLLVVNDLERSRSGLLGAWLFSRLLTRNRFTRNDAPLSVRRAYSRDEALAMARAAGWRDAAVRPVVPFRFVLTGSP
jgi:ubiquinone/menaquinone biosynthesis C-methylase UbiE